VVGPVASSMEVRVQGQERVLRDITTGKKLVGILDLSMTKEGENVVRLSPDDISRPAEVSVTHMSLSEVKVRLEPLIRKTFRLKPVVHGVPASGYRLKNIVITPPKISVEGPSSVVKMLDSLQTMPIDIQGSAENRSIEPKIDYQGQSLKLIEKNVEVRIIIERMNR
jgi:YbbR domain-containing protein